MRTEKFQDLFDFAKKSKVKAGDGLDEGNFPFFTSSSILKKRINEAQHFDEALIFGTGGSASVHFAGEPFATSTDCIVAITKEEDLNAKFVYYYLFGNIHLLERGFKGAGLKHISKKYIENLDIPILPVETQNKIVSVLDKAASMNEKRQLCFDLIDKALFSYFNEIFGDPVNNPKGWPIKNFEKSVLIMRDGPFGSNLKTDHYTESGIRVIRLQNIGVNVFNDDNKMYISSEHADFLKKHTCLAGDVLVGTLGEPNLRACKFPSKLFESAINKADCIQIRPNDSIAIDSYISFLLNHPGALFFVSNYIKGQTRTRISKGMLSRIDIPIPPIDLQQKFKMIEGKFESLKEKLLDKGFANLNLSLIQKVFNGQLNFNVDFELDALIKEIDLQKKQNDLSKIEGDIAYLQRLIDKLNGQEFKDKDLYDKAKHGVFQMLAAKEVDKKVIQEFDESSKSLKLALK
ncbi:restriction endonuclease subunit S [Owenweeksia hongkongensis]|uniref:restriction endonuclease subunit S n=1 Tax=Owenweeksia hongkongensis TaxID=253245 RepID=UPI003A9524D8